MSKQVAARRHTSRGAPRIDRGRRIADRPSGRRLLLLAVLSCAGVLALGAGAAQSLAAGLPDNRAYELVSPAAKAGEVEHLVIVAGDQAAPDGNSLGYVALSPLVGNGSGIDNWQPGDRPAGRRRTRCRRRPPGSRSTFLDTRLYSSDLSKGVLSNGGATLGGLAGQDFPFLDPGTCTTRSVPDAASDHDDPVHRRADRQDQLVPGQSQHRNGAVGRQLCPRARGHDPAERRGFRTGRSDTRPQHGGLHR